MSEEERQAIIHLLDKQARYEYARKNNISFSDEDYEAYIIRQSMIDKDKEIERLQSIIKEVREWAKKCSCQFTNDDGELVVSEISFNIQARPCDLFKILDKEVN